MTRPAPTSALHRVGVHGRSLELRIPADLVRELQIVRREYALITRGPGRTLVVQFPEPGRGDHGPVLDLAALARPRPEPAEPAEALAR